MKIKIFLLSALIMLAINLKAQETALAVFAGVDRTISGLGDLQAQIGGTIARSINQASQNLRTHQDQLRATLGSKITEPINNLNLNLQNQVRLLSNTAANLNQFVSWQRECIFKNAEGFQAALLTAGLQLESNVRFIGKTNDPYVSSLSFDGKPDYVVPLQGGRATIKGLFLYTDYAPVVKVYNEKGDQVLLNQIKVDRAGSNNDVSIFVDASFIASNLGKIVYFEVTPRKSGWFGSLRELKPIRIPMKIPETTKYKYQIKSYVAYKWEKSEVLERPELSWGREETNSECGKVKAISGQHTFDIGKDCKIINIKGGQTVERYMNDGGNIQFSIIGDDVIGWAGTVGRPSCTIIWPTIQHLNSHAFYRFSIWPEVRKTSYIEEQTSNRTSAFTLNDNQTSIPIILTINPNPRKDTVFWYEIAKIATDVTSDTVYRSPRYTADENGVSSNTFTGIDGYKFDLVLNNKTVNNTVEISATITAPASCGSL